MIHQSLWQTAIELQDHLDAAGHRFCFIGGLVVQRWGQPRVTGDVDATILCAFGDENQLATEILQHYRSRIADPVQFALQARILLLQAARGNKIGLSIGGLDFEERGVDRSSVWGVQGGGQIRTCSAEDLVFLKSFASRDQDWIDVRNVLIRQAEKLDRDLIRNELNPLVDLKEEPDDTRTSRSSFLGQSPFALPTSGRRSGPKMPQSVAPARNDQDHLKLRFNQALGIRRFRFFRRPAMACFASLLISRNRLAISAAHHS